MLLLDEATSALDAESERAVSAALAAASRGRSVVIVAHRLATLWAADRVIVLDRGRVVEEGPPAELAKLKGPFAALLALQSPRTAS